MTQRKIIDVSAYNGTIDWKKVKKYGCDGAIIKIIRKDLGKDKKFEENYKSVRNWVSHGACITTHTLLQWRKLSQT